MKKYSPLLFLLLCMVQFKCFAAAQLTLVSTAFTMNSMIPNAFTCNGSNESPPLTWSNIPKNTQSLALIVDDPDAPDGLWTHWVLFNIPPTTTGLKAGTPLPSGAATGKNSWGSLGYRGPCPTMGAHSYHFKLYALDTLLNLGEGTTRELVLNAMTGHVIGSAELDGLYQKI